MKRIGNIVSNRNYNPKQKRANIPIDADEVESAMERFIRDKYQHKSLAGESRPPAPRPAQATGGSDSGSDSPPPLPPKNGASMGTPWRSQSSTYPTKTRLPSPPRNERGNGAGIVAQDSKSTFDLKLDRLRDMGFANASRNATILKGTGGDLDSAVATLTRLGEGYGNVLPRAREQRTGEQRSASAAHAFNAQPMQPANGLSTSRAEAISPTPNQNQSGFAPPQSAPPLVDTSMDAFTQSMQSLAVSPAQTPNPAAQTNPFWRTFNQEPAQNPQSSYFAPQPTGVQPIRSNTNPFMHSPAPQAWQPQPGAMSPGMPNYAPPSWPYDMSQPQSQMMNGGQPNIGPANPMPMAQSPYAAQSPGPPSFHQYNGMTPSTPFAGPDAFFGGSPGPSPAGYQAQAGMTQRAPGHLDKNSIMALYQNQSFQQQQPQQTPATGFAPQPQPPQRSTTVPLPQSSNNPFAINSNPNAASTQGHASRDSIMFTGNAYTVRSQSPDAFAGLSARAG